jgi:hypothetical protein
MVASATGGCVAALEGSCDDEDNEELPTGVGGSRGKDGDGVICVDRVLLVKCSGRKLGGGARLANLGLCNAA